MENPSSMQKLVQQFDLSGFPYLSTELTPIVGPGDTVNCYCLREILEKYVKFNNCYPRIDNYEYLFRCSTHLRSNRKVNATLTMLKDLQTPLALIRLFDSKELVKHYSDDTEHKKLANMVLLKIRAMKMEEKRQDGYHFFLPFFVSSKCSLIIPRVLFEHGHLTSLVCMTIPMILPVGFTIERFVALIMARSYENVRTFLGPLLVLVLTVIDCSILYAIYHDDPFTDNFINFILIPSNSAQKFNMFFWALVVIKVTNFLCNSILLFIHKRMEKITIKHSSTLSTKYNMEEISQSSRFTLTVTFAHLLFFGWYVGSILFIRTVGPDFFGGTVNYSIMRGVYCATPTYNLVIVFIGIKAIRRLNVQRKNRISSTVQVKSTGDEGAKNYDNAISNYWDTVYTEKKNVKY
ncbi:hypothetical protein L3Y34_018682 [Caenorhabditis briggsae]|uniref:Uncharacterized protein n=1 Tax=Caenorhabditis briggsae TaxID=6238 RepID=A0AAE9DKW2_CAEBR|nr:hypothetical protein L3Y34_018682 [Caenorhabditis briggsae]